MTTKNNEKDIEELPKELIEAIEKGLAEARAGKLIPYVFDEDNDD